MRRVLCIWFPNWPIQRLRHARHELNQRPLLIYSDQGRSGLRITACSREAAQSNVRVGMPLAEARAMWKGHASRRLSAQPACIVSDPIVDRLAMQQLAQDCQRYTPLVGLENVPQPDTLFLDVAGCEHLHQNEYGLVRAIFKDFRSRGYDVQLAVAETLGAAWALAHYGTGLPRVAGAQQQQALQRLPVAALRLETTVLQKLLDLGIKTIGDLQQLPRSSLPSRFGTGLLQSWDQAVGNCQETFLAEKFVEPLAETWSTEDLFSDQHSVAEVFRLLLNRLLPRLSERNTGILEMVCSFQAEQAVASIELQLSRPTLDASHLCQLFELRCEQHDWQTGIYGLRLEIVRAGWLRETPLSLFEDPQHDPRAVDLLMERLSCRLGPHAVSRPLRVPDALPERAFRLVPWLGKDTSFQPAESPASSFESHQRPWHLLTTPERLEVVPHHQDGPPQRLEWKGDWQRVVRCWGPERIETGWWREREIRRDYYRVETERGQHCWVFRQCESGRWFLHGWF